MKKLFAFFTLTLLVLSGCSKSGGSEMTPYGGINTGNPDVKSAPAETFAVQILQTHCQKLKDCRSGFPMEECLSRGKSASSFKQSFLKNPNQGPSSIDALKRLEDEKKIEFNFSSFKDCVDAVKNLECSNSKVGQAWSPSNPSEFDSIFRLSLGQNSCKESFRQP